LIAVAVDADAAPTSQVADLDEAASATKLREAVTDLVRAVATAPTLLAAEDWGAVDASTRALLDTLVRRSADRPWFVLINRRPDETPFAGVPSMVLEPLSPGDTAELVRMASGESLLPQEAAALAERSAGNPLFAAELARMTAGDGLPESLHASTVAALDRLAPGDREVVRAASVVGRVAPRRLLTRVLPDTPRISIEGALDRAAAFMEVDSHAARFRHDLYRSAAYESLSYRRRRTLHARAYAALATARKPESAALAAHAYGGALWEEAFEHAKAAALAAENAYAFPEAARHFEVAARTAELSGRPAIEVADLVLCAGRHLFLSGDFRAGIATYTRARRLARGDPALSAKAGMLLGHALADMGQEVAADRALARATRLAAEHDLTDVLAPALVARAQVASKMGRYRLAQALATEGASLAREVADKRAEADAMATLHRVTAWQALPDSGGYGDRALALYATMDLGGAIRAVVHNDRGVRAYLTGDLEAAAASYGEAAAQLEAAGLTGHALNARANIAEIHVDQERDDAAGMIDALLPVARVVGGDALPFLLLLRVRAAVRAADNAGALAAFSELIDVAPDLEADALTYLSSVTADDEGNG
jgi:tetratricopeptide (TPR) repeat protein